MATLSKMFTKKDLELLRRKKELQAEIAEIDATLKPKISKAVQAFGDGEHKVHGTTLLFKSQTRVTTSWKPMVYKLCTEEQIEKVFDEFSKVGNSYSIKEAIDNE